MNSLSAVILNTTVVVLGLSSLLLVLEATGLLPSKISGWLNRNRLSETIKLLQELGVDVKNLKRTSIARSFPDYHSTETYKDELDNALSRRIIELNVKVGRTESATFDQYINVMGATSSPRQAEYFARFLSTHLRRTIDKGEIRTSDFTFIACPKQGSPFLAYELAKIINKPLVLHSSEAKFQSAIDHFDAFFDSDGDPPQRGAVALLVDDSTTGGRMMLNLVSDLRRFGYSATDCLVLFEPMGKNARRRLADQGVQLHSITSGSFRLDA